MTIEEKVSEVTRLILCCMNEPDISKKTRMKNDIANLKLEIREEYSHVQDDQRI